MAATAYPMLSSDGHLEALPERWSGRMPAKYRSLAPHTTTLPDGSDTPWRWKAPLPSRSITSICGAAARQRTFSPLA